MMKSTFLYLLYILIIFCYFLSFCQPIELIDLQNIQLKLLEDDVIKSTVLNSKVDNEDSVKYYEYYKKKKFTHITGNIPILVYPLFFKSASFGNNFGQYLDILSCVHDTGTHLIGIPVQFPYDNFTKSFHQIYMNAHPVESIDESIKLMESKCLVSMFPWGTFRATWFKHIPFIGNSMVTWLNSYLLNEYGVIYPRIQVANESGSDNYAMINPQNLTEIPLIPDVAILFRCSDILHFSSSMYGFLPFILYDLLIPEHAETIYILSEPLHYGQNGKLCKRISTELIKYISNLLPKAYITIRRGHHYDSMSIIQKANFVISCPSTFSFWPAISNNAQNSKVYFYHGSLLLNGQDLYINENFHWITYPELVGFGEYILDDPDAKETFELIMDKLTAKPWKRFQLL